MTTEIPGRRLADEAGGEEEVILNESSAGEAA
jgi:hypothetical protein